MVFELFFNCVTVQPKNMIRSISFEGINNTYKFPAGSNDRNVKW